MNTRFGAVALMLCIAACHKKEKPPQTPHSDLVVSDAAKSSSLAFMLAKDPQFSWLTVITHPLAKRERL